jgi:adenosylcobyric acid synthase
MVDGYEIHNGTAKKRAKKKKNLYGTFVHGLFDNDTLRETVFSAINPAYKGYNFKEFKSQAIDEFAEHINSHINIQQIIDQLH